ncbi:hypothetical protein NKH14_17685 [Mesorhizobium sp. M1380]|uniref:hypothetical protein n=1 Tax=Mesorhizobium sp. M1380 TaxID=2957093 RepID=UPI003338B547
MAGTAASYKDALAATRNRSVTTVGGLDIARIIAVDETDAVVPQATSTLQTAGNTKLDMLHADLAAVEGFVDGIEGLMTTLNAKDFATQTTLAAILAKIIAAPATEVTLAAILTALAVVPVRSNDGIVTRSVDITRPADTTQYAVGDALSDSTSAPTVGGFTFTDAVRAAGKSCFLSDIIVTSSSSAATALQGEIYIFDTAVTALNDNAAFGVTDAEIKTLVAKVPFIMAVGTNNNHVHLQNLGIGLTAVGGRDFRFLVKVLNTYTPISGEVLTIRAKFAPVD